MGTPTAHRGIQRAAAIVALAASALMSSPALAATTTATATPTGHAPLSTIDGTQMGTVTVHTDPHDLFQILPVRDTRCAPIDLTAETGWSALTDRVATQDTPTPCEQSSPITSARTDASGTVSFTLPIGPYWVVDRGTPESTLTQHAAPALVTVPMTDPAHGDRWLYDVDVHPKQPAPDIVETVEDSHPTHLPDGHVTVTWHIDVAVPGVDPADPLRTFQVGDTLDPRLAVLSQQLHLDTDTGTTPLREGADYRFTVLQRATGLRWQLTAAGIALITANPGAHLRVDVGTKFLPGSAPSGGLITVHDTARFDYTTTHGAEGMDEAVSPPSKWGALDVLKTDADTGAPLADARFRLYETADDARTGAHPISVNGRDTFATGKDGRARIPQLRASTFIDGRALPTDQWRPYYLVEVAAPAGHRLDPTPHAVFVIDNEPAPDATISNARGASPVPGHIAPTGAEIAAVTAAGLTLLLASLLVLWADRTRRESTGGRR